MKEYTYSNGIKACTIEEGNLGAVKCSDDFGGPNQWRLYIRDVEGRWEDIQWGHVSKFQQFFKTKLPVYKEQAKQTKYELV
jgi:hypothetical protein